MENGTHIDGPNHPLTVLQTSNRKGFLMVLSYCPQQGFGNIDGEYWLGLENIYWLTNQANYKLLVTLEDWSGRKVFAEYASFRLEPEADFYKLRVGRYHGNAGDSLTWHNGKQFTTLDRDHDAYTGMGGTWVHACIDNKPVT